MKHHTLLASRLLMYARRFLRNDQLLLSGLAVVIGVGVGALATGFRLLISLFQAILYESPDEQLTTVLSQLPWWHVLIGPTIGGLMVGGFIYTFMPGRRPQGVADIMEAVALKSGRVSLRAGIGAAMASAASLGFGASLGREGPAVHLGATFSAWVAERLRLTRPLSRTLLGCGTAAAVAASFNAPIAGALFAHEVVVGHYALSAFAPIVVASVTGTAVSRAYFGDFPAFQIMPYELASLWEFPAFALLGVLCGVIAAGLTVSVGRVDTLVRRLPVPPWLRPAVGGFALGLIGLALPEVLGVGYQAVDAALIGTYSFGFLLLLLVAKVVATSITLGSGFAGGVFSPSLFMGAMLGGAFGIIAGDLFPAFYSGQEAYTLIGMGGLSAAVLGAPISTPIIIFEMTADYSLTIGVMLCAVIATVVTRHLKVTSFFTWQLARRGIDLLGGLETSLLKGIPVADIMAPVESVVSPQASLPTLRTALLRSASGVLLVTDDDDTLLGAITLSDLDEAAFNRDMDDLVVAGDLIGATPCYVLSEQGLDEAFAVFHGVGGEYLAVVDDAETRRVVGCLSRNTLWQTYNKALLSLRREEQDGL